MDVMEIMSLDLSLMIDIAKANLKYLPTAYSVLGFGAKGDGVNDDTQAIQEAINTASLKGGAVFFPDGIYSVSRLTISDNVRFLSFGKATLKHSVYVGSMIYISGTGIEVSFDGLFFDGNNVSQIANSMNYIIEARAIGTLTAPMYVRVNNCEFRNQCYASINFYSDLGAGTGQEYLYVEDCRFFGGNEGTSTSYDPKYISVNDGGYAYIGRNLFDLQRTPTSFGIAGVNVLSTTPSTVVYSSVIIENNEFWRVGRYASNGLGVVDFYIFSENVQIKGNKFYNNYFSAIKGKTNSKSVEIVGNFINGTPSQAAIDINPATYGTTEDNFIVADNIIKNSGNHAIIIDALDADYLSRVIVRGNIIDVCAATGVSLNRLNNAVVTGNMINSCTLQAVNLIKCSGEFEITQNVIVSTGSFGIYLDTTVTGIKIDISHNNIKSPTKYGIYANLVKAVTIIGNIIDSVILQSSQVGISVGNVTEAAIIQGNQVIGQSSNYLVIIGGTSTIATFIESGNSWNGSQFYGTSAPTTGTYKVGDKVWNSSPAASGYVGWICTTAGTPGTWKGFGTIQA